MIRATIDGKEAIVPEETTILKAARQLGIHIPTLCYMNKLEPMVACRVCLVEVEGAEKPVTACNTPLVEGMIVNTQSERLNHLRKEAIEFILINHPLDCPVCDAGGECELQNLAYELGVTKKNYSLEPLPTKINYDWPLIEYHGDRCIRCLRCVNICWEVQGCGALRLNGQGYESYIDTVDGKSLNCDFCGQCVQACPVGALINKPFKFKARSWELKRTPSVCPHCGLGCSIELHVKDGRLLRVMSTDEDAPNRGNLCSRGFFGYGFVNNPKRLTSPLLRKSGELVPVTWEEALDYVADNLMEIVNQNSPGAVGGIASACSTNEDGFLFQKFLRTTVGTPNIDSIASVGYRQAIRLLEEATGIPGASGNLDALSKAGSILVIGCDLAKEMPVASLSVIQSARDRGTRLVTANPVGTKLDEFATSRLRYKPGSEAALLSGLMKAIMALDNYDRSSLKGRIENELELRSAIEKLPWNEIENSTGINAGNIQDAARDFMQKEGRCLIFGHFLLGQKSGEINTKTAVNLGLLAGCLSFENGGIFPSVIWSNMQGILDMGVAPDRLPGHQRFEVAESLGKIWGRKLPENEGLSSFQMINAIDRNEISALYLMGVNPIVSFPDTERVEKALQKLKLLVVHDSFLTETAKLAHCVLPTATFAEIEGTFTNADRRVQLLRPVLGGKGKCLPDWKILSMLSEKMGFSMNYSKAGNIMQEIAQIVPQYHGLNYSELENNGRQRSLNEKTIIQDKIQRKYLPVSFLKNQKEKGNSDYPFTLLIGPSLHLSGKHATRTQELLSIEPESIVEINPEDASRLGIAEGDTVFVSSRNGCVELKSKTTERCPSGVLWTSPCFPQHRVNVLTKTDYLCHVRLEKKA